MSLFEKLKETLVKTKKNITQKVDELFGYYDQIDDDLFDELEEILILSDLGFKTTDYVIKELKNKIFQLRINEPKELRKILKEILFDLINSSSSFDVLNPKKVILIIGINGAGKTTSIGKIANLLKNNNKSVLLAAADTFRAAAIDQLKIWAKRAESDILYQSEGSDPASVVYDAINSQKSKNYDVLIVDSAGRLHNNKNLMKELEKIKRIISNSYNEEEIMTLLVLDSSTGQNAINQAILFKEYAKMDGIILTKLDGTSKGGFVFSIKRELDIPIYFITTGEKIDDIELFDAKHFVDSLFDI